MSPQDRALAQLFWVAPRDLSARTDVPQGLGVDGRPRLVITLQTGESAPIVRRFTLEHGARSGNVTVWQLRGADYRRFTDAQQRVVASIGTQAMVDVGLEVAYCATDSPAGSGRPLAELHDRESGTVMMSQPAAVSARALQPTLPACR